MINNAPEKSSFKHLIYKIITAITLITALVLIGIAVWRAISNNFDSVAIIFTCLGGILLVLSLIMFYYTSRYIPSKKEIVEQATTDADIPVPENPVPMQNGNPDIAKIIEQQHAASKEEPTTEQAPIIETNDEQGK